MGYRVGVDVGGTFTDLICVTPDGEVVLDKTPTTLDDQSTGVMNGLAQLAERFGLSLADLCAQLDIVVHGTTTADNTMIEMNGAPTGLLVTEGHRDEIEMRRVPQGGDLGPDATRRRSRSPGAGPASRSPSASTSRATSCSPLDEDAVRARRAPAPGSSASRSIAVMFLFSFVNPDARAPRRRDHPRGVPRRRAHLAVARGDGPRARSSSGCRPRS